MFAKEGPAKARSLRWQTFRAIASANAETHLGAAEIPASLI